MNRLTCNATSTLPKRGCASATPRPLFPADLRDWVDERVLVCLVLDAVSSQNSDHLGLRRITRPDEDLQPCVMLSLLVFAYATGRYASDLVEASLETDPTLRYLCANRYPTWNDIRRFRRLNRVPLTACLEALFRRVMALRASGELHLGPPTCPLPTEGDSASQPSAEIPAVVFLAAANECVANAVFADTMAMDV